MQLETTKVMHNALYDLGWLYAEGIDVKQSSALLTARIKAYVARHLWGEEGYYRVIHNIDNAFQRAVGVLSSPE